jgi:ribose transport system permease protein
VRRGKLLGVLGLLAAICLYATFASDRFLTPFNLENLIQRTSLFGLLSLGAAFVIVTGGIDLSIGSVVCVIGCLVPHLLLHAGWHPVVAVAFGLLLCALLGLGHGLLVTALRLQPFVVTLCGLLLYRGLMRWFTDNQNMGLGDSYAGLRWLALGRIPLTAHFGLPVPAVVLLLAALLAGVFLNRTVPGRHLLALGRNEEAARFSGVATSRLIVTAYVLCSLLSGLGGLLFLLDVNSVQASTFGNFYELYAIAGAVLGGCALRGGEVSVTGVVAGAAVMQVLQNTIRLVDKSDHLEFAVVGGVILAGAAADEVVRRLLRRRGG